MRVETGLGYEKGHASFVLPGLFGSAAWQIIGVVGKHKFVCLRAQLEYI